jgi:D-glycero-alpha-D-manno-heptose-7-phosphate kinase
MDLMSTTAATATVTGAATASVLYDRELVNTSTVIRSRSPLRISFVGGGTDLPHYYEEHGGAVLSSTINRYAFATLRPRNDQAIRITALDSGNTAVYQLQEESADPDGMFDLVRAAIRRMGMQKGFELDLRSDAPRGSGLGGSSAATAAILGTLIEYSGVVLDAYEMSELNYIIERLDLGIAGGKQDQYASTFGGFNLIEFSKEHVHVTPLRLPAHVLHDLEDHLILCYTGKIRPTLGLVESRVNAYQRGEITVLEGMRRLHQMVYEAKEFLLKGRLHEFGALLDEGMTNKKKMNPHVSTPFIDELYETAKKSGAIGGKLLGAGGGGYLLLMVGERRRFQVCENLQKAGGVITDFSFQDKGLNVWRSRCF